MTPADRTSALRIIDANLNRASEALRVVEDVCRFHWNLQHFAAELKSLRHALFESLAAAGLEREELLRGRDIEGDVGRDNASPDRGQLPARQLAIRNLQRGKEAIRALEEASRLCVAAAALPLEQLRYRLYALEKGIVRLPPQTDLVQRMGDVRVYLIATSSSSPRPLEDIVQEAVRAGCGAVQLREKRGRDREHLAVGRRLREITATAGALFLVNDRPDLARLVAADGVHVGQDDLPPAEVRRIVGDSMLVGLSTHTLEQAAAASAQGADYIGVGPVYATKTKAGAGEPIGAAQAYRMSEAGGLPAFAIGGIDPTGAAELGVLGCSRVAVSRAVLEAPDVAAAVAELDASLPRSAPTRS